MKKTLINLHSNPVKKKQKNKEIRINPKNINTN